MSRAGIKDIAKKANVSIGTVDRVLHDRGQVSEKTKRNVLKVIEDLNYEPNKMASSLASKKVFKISVLLPKPIDQNNYWYYPVSGINKALGENKDINVELQNFFYEINDVEDFKAKAQQVIDHESDGVITAPVHDQELTHFIKKMQKANIKYAFIDSDLKRTNRSFYIGQDTFQSGRVAAQLMHYCLSNNIYNILILRIYSVFHGIPAINQREQGFIQFLREVNPYQSFQIKSIEYKSGDDIGDKITSIINSHYDFSAIFVPNSRSYLVAPYLRNLKKKKPLLLGFDVIEKNRALMEEGLIDFLISQRPIHQGYEAFQHLLRILIERKKSTILKNIPIDIITKENLDSYDHLEV